MQINIRRARPEDIDWLIGQLKDFSEFFGTKKRLFENEDFARTGMLRMIEGHVVLIAESESHRMGFISGLITPHIYNPEIKTLLETFWWVAEEFRGTKAGLKLLNAFTDWGKANVDWILFSLESHSPVNDKSLIKRGFKPQEKTYLMEVN